MLEIPFSSLTRSLFTLRWFLHALAATLFYFQPPLAWFRTTFVDDGACHPMVFGWCPFSNRKKRHRPGITPVSIFGFPWRPYLLSEVSGGAW